jgi:hypothetical protein
VETVEEFVESALNYMSAKEAFTAELVHTLELPPRNIKYVELKASTNGTTFNHIIVVHLMGENSFKSENLGKIKGLTLKTPNTLEIEFGEIKL